MYHTFSDVHFLDLWRVGDDIEIKLLGGDEIFQDFRDLCNSVYI